MSHFLCRRVAIVGFAFRFPGQARHGFWEALLEGGDLVGSVDPARFSTDAYAHPGKTEPGTSYTFAAGSLGDVAGFDAAFFGISPREARQMDPQQRLLLELSWEALEDAGVTATSLRGSRCGVYVGLSGTDYAFRIAGDLGLIDASTMTGSTASIAANRISYCLDLKGPSMIIDTACSSSLVAFHQACQSIAVGESEQALVGGVSLHLHPYTFVGFSKASMLSKGGRCRVFDAAGDGYARSEGCGVLLLKDLQAALRDGNRIHAVVAASGANCDGKTPGLTVPSLKAQAELLETLYAQADIAPDDIDYLEAHGTGTAVGDPIETHAIGLALGQKRRPGSPLPIGSVKSNLGHLETASGIAGLAKALLCLRHRRVPPTIHLNRPNPNIRFEEWNIQAVTETLELPAGKTLVVGVNSFGFGGANAHVILERDPALAAVPLPAPALDGGNPPLLISARGEAALKETARRYAAHLRGRPELDFHDIAHSAAVHRDWHGHRAIVYGSDREAAASLLEAFAEAAEGADTTRLVSGQALPDAGQPVFVYSGNGSQWQGMGVALLESDTVFRAAVEAVDGLFQRHADFSIVEELRRGQDEGRLGLTEVAQPLLFAVQVGITEMLRGLGLKPAAVFGHSVGEVAAAWAAGALSLEQAVQVVFHRSAEQGKTRGLGQMTAASLGREAMAALLAETRLADRLDIAGHNSPGGTTLSGEVAALEAIEAELTRRNVFCKRLDLDYAFHSPAMDGLQADIEHSLSGLRPTATHTLFVSTVTGTGLAGEQLDAHYWWRNIRQPVQFEAAASLLIGQGHGIFIEIGPHAVLRYYLDECLRVASAQGRTLPTMLRADGSEDRILAAFHQAVVAGAPVDPAALFPRPGRFVDLPNYAWQKERHWLEYGPDSYDLINRRFDHPLLGYRLHENAWQWENHLDTCRHPEYADHVVGGATAFPAAGLVELALAAAAQWRPSEAQEIESLEIRAPLLLEHEHSKAVRLSIDPADGSFTIKSRNRQSAEPWLLNAVGRLPQATATAWEETRSSLPPTPALRDGEAHYQRTSQVGLAYGPAFRLVSAVWIDGTTASASLLPPQTDGQTERLLLHPACLDGALQLLVDFIPDDADAQPAALVPIQIGRLRLLKPHTPAAFAHTRILRDHPRSLLAEVELFDGQGRLIARLDDVRFRRLRLSQPNQAKPGLFGYQTIAMPRPADGACLPPLCELAAAWQADAPEALRRHVDEVDPLLDVLCASYAGHSLQGYADAAGILDPGLLLASGRVAAERRPLLERLLAILKEDGIIEPEGTGWRFTDEADLPEPLGTWTTLLEDYPDCSAQIIPLGRLGLRLPAILAGADGAENLLPDETGPFLDPAWGRHAAKAFAGLIHAAQAQGRRLRVLELAHRRPLFAAPLLTALGADRCDYVLASGDANLIADCRHLQGRFPGLELRLLKAGMAAWDAQAGRFDLILLPDGLGQEADIHASLGALAGLLAGGGTLASLEPQPSRSTELLLAASPTGRPPWRGPEAWRKLLTAQGFAETEILTLAEGSAVGPCLLLGRPEPIQAATPTAAPAKTWLILHDGSSQAWAQRLAGELRGQGQGAILAAAGTDFAPREAGAYSFAADSAEGCKILLTNLAEIQGEIAGWVHLIGFGQAFTDDAASLLARQELRCGTVLRLLQAGEALGLAPEICLVSAGLADARDPGDAALWGLGRTLINEYPGIRIRLVDVAESGQDTQAASTLAWEILHPDDEDEIILSTTGRHVPRLRPLPPAPAQTTDPDRSIVRLDFQTPGRLRNLVWQQATLPAPAEGEVEIEVRAAGLNFRDVMYAMGMLSDEAVENGFSGPTLGMELAGVVRGVGGGVSGFAIGDEVIAFAPACFASRVVTKANAVAAKPADWSFEAATTIPTAFFTAYYALHHLAGLQPGEKLLIHGAAGGVGIAAIRIARWLGAEIFATAGSDEKRDFVALLGADHVRDSRSLAFADEILALTQGAGVDVVLNSLAGEAVNRNFRLLKPFGRFLELGKRDFYENTKVGLRPFRNNISYFGIDADQLLSTRPALARKLFQEVMALFGQESFKPLPYRAFPAEEVVDAFRHMRRSKHIGKIVVSFEPGFAPATDNTPQPPPLRLDAQATYLVTGGLGGFGLKTAQWLARKGARHLLLLSRRGPADAEARAAIAALQNQGVTIQACACDVSDRAALEAVFNTALAGMPPLRGVIHAAAVFDDGLARTMDAAQLHRVFVPKILGTLHLHELTRALPLDFFLLYSSATTLFGNPGQSNYVAANTFLESLAAWRRAQGLPGLAVGWGPIDDAGYLARNTQVKDALTSRMGGAALDSGQALDILERLIVSGETPDINVLDLDWNALSRFLPSAGAAKFRELARHGEEHKDSGAEGDIQRWLKEMPADALKPLFIDLLRQEVGGILRIAPDKIDAGKSVYDMGMDSLMGVELITAVQARFGVSLPVMALSEGPTLERLAGRIIDQLMAPQGSAEALPPAHAAREQVLHLASLHGTEIDADTVATLSASLQTGHEPTQQPGRLPTDKAH